MDGLNKRLLRPDEVAAVLNVDRSTVYRIAGKGDFVCLKVGSALRITGASVDRYIRKQIEKHYIDNG